MAACSAVPAAILRDARKRAPQDEVCRRTTTRSTDHSQYMTAEFASMTRAFGNLQETTHVRTHLEPIPHRTRQGGVRHLGLWRPPGLRQAAGAAHHRRQ